VMQDSTSMRCIAALHLIKQSIHQVGHVFECLPATFVIINDSSRSVCEKDNALMRVCWEGMNLVGDHVANVVSNRTDAPHIRSPLMA
jgi:hypothetical protein